MSRLRDADRYGLHWEEPWPALTIPLAHDFWNMSGHEAFLETIISQEHSSVIGGLFAAAIAARLQGSETR